MYEDDNFEGVFISWLEKANNYGLMITTNGKDTDFIDCKQFSLTSNNKIFSHPILLLNDKEYYMELLYQAAQLIQHNTEGWEEIDWYETFYQIEINNAKNKYAETGDTKYLHQSDKIAVHQKLFVKFKKYNIQVKYPVIENELSAEIESRNKELEKEGFKKFIDRYKPMIRKRKNN